ncbi:CLIP domain-containing serine protease B4-like [Diabrotica undecimpunctata]|uniref:CLIP domain-containing serine protease B4-like n=1 Tax=Diabrotica undecimpunctata TaxID=50387 RepID=UPI003B63756A
MKVLRIFINMSAKNSTIFLILILFAYVGNSLQSQFSRNPLIPDAECGHSVPSNSSSLVGNHEFPWSARISFSNSPGKFYCDGVLINKRYILTTGRCLEPQRNIDKIRLGDHNCLPSENCHQNDYVDVDIEKVILHPGYGVEDGLTKDNIALIRLNKDIKSTDNISPVCLPKLNEIAKAGDKVIEIGWSMANSTYNKKLKTEATISDQLKCFKTYEQNFGVKLTNFHLCSEGYPEDRCASIMNKIVRLWFTITVDEQHGHDYQHRENNVLERDVSS